MLRHTMIAVTLTALLLGAGRLQADVLDEDGGGSPACGLGRVLCRTSTVEKCLEYQTVSVTIGTKVVTEVACKKKVVTTTYIYHD